MRNLIGRIRLCLADKLIGKCSCLHNVTNQNYEAIFPKVGDSACNIRRAIWRIIRIAHREGARQDRVLVATVDSSGSMLDWVRKHIESKLDYLSQTFSVIVIEHNINVTSSYPWRGSLGMVLPGGGTSMKDALREAMAYNPAMVFCFTDGYHNPADVLTPVECPVFWMLVGDRSSVSFPFGVVVDADGWMDDKIEKSSKRN